MLRLRMIAFTKQLQCKNLQDFIHLQLVQHSQCKSLPPPATTEAGADSPDWSPVSGLVECESLEVLTNPTLPDPTAEWEQ